MLLFRKFDESPLTFSGLIEKSKVIDWMVGNSVPTIFEFSEDYIEPIFGNRKQAIFLFRSTSDANSGYSKVFE